MGHLPFEAEISSNLIYGGKNSITVAVDNILLQTSVPQGRIVDTVFDNGTKHTQSYTFDFFNYAGIHRQANKYLCYTKLSNCSVLTSNRSYVFTSIIIVVILIGTS